MATHSNIPAREIPWTEEPGGLQYMGLQRIRHGLATKEQQHSPQYIQYRGREERDSSGLLSHLCKITSMYVHRTPVSPVTSFFLNYKCCTHVRKEGCPSDGKLE